MIEAVRKSRAARTPRALMSVVTAYQVAAFGEGADSVGRMLAEQGSKADAVAQVRTMSLIGTASDGRSMGGLVDVMQGLAPVYRDRIVTTQIADAARSGSRVGMAVRPRVKGYVRQVNAGACDRCAILAGVAYRSQDAFERHPRCSCTNIPVAEDNGDDYTTDPRAFFDSLDEAAQDATFTKAGASAIRDGADMAQVVNARSGMSSAQVSLRGRYVAAGRKARDASGLYTTTAGMSARGVAGMALGPGKVRLMPESIVQIATSTEDRLRLLKVHGYIR